jgi:hypothetical protein
MDSDESGGEGVMAQDVGWLIEVCQSRDSFILFYFFTDFDVHVDNSPFKHCIVENFISDTKYLKELKEELLNLRFSMKRNDLYQFHQSCDLSAVNRPLINSLRQFLVEECCKWLGMATGIKLNNKVSVTCSSYNYSGKYLYFNFNYSQSSHSNSITGLITLLTKSITY